uniref:Uncharacterized protein n=1 Tax=Tanacetum cinerariifolium TaxID=118510 RepID=A0A699J3J1_TANCI|nr:hypothetical protein [Tanacetum cinerariifolium]
MDPEDDVAYIDIPAYPLPAPPAQTPPSPEWLSGSFPVSSAPSAVPSPISSHMISLTVPSPTPKATIPIAEDHIDRDVRELYTRLGVARAGIEGMTGHVDTRMADMSWTGYDDHRLVHDMLVQQAALQRKLQEMRGRVTALEHERDRREQ